MHAVHEEQQADPALHERWAARTMAVVRMTLGLLWLTNTGWKLPPDFGEAGGGSLYGYTQGAVEFPVFQPYSWLVEEVVLPNFRAFGWTVWLIEICLAAFLLVGLGTRFWGLVGAFQAAAIGLSVGQTPDEWPWAYYLMVAAQLSVFACAAGRTWGLDGLLRPILLLRQSRVARWVVRST